MAMREEEEEELIRRTSSSGSTDMMQDFSNMRTSSVPDVDVLSTMHPDTKWHQARRSKGDAEDFAKMFKTMIADEKNIFGHGLTAGDVKVLAALAHTLILKPGEIFCAEGEQAEHLVVIIEGVVSVITLRRVFASLGPGRFIGEIGLVKGFHIRSATIRAETTCKLAVLPYKKFLRFLKSLGEEKESALLSFCVNALVPRYHALDFFKLKHRSATLIQSNFRSHIAQQLLKQKKSRVLLRSAQRIQKLFRHYKEHVLEKTAFQTPFVETLQKAYRSHHARREFRRIRRMRREGYGARHERAAGIIQRTFRLKILKKAARKHGHLTKMGSLLEDLDEEQKQRTTNTFQSLVHRGDTLNVFQKWKRVLIVRSFNSWQTLVRATARSPPLAPSARAEQQGAHARGEGGWQADREGAAGGAEPRLRLSLLLPAPLAGAGDQHHGGGAVAGAGREAGGAVDGGEGVRVRPRQARRGRLWLRHPPPQGHSPAPTPPALRLGWS